MLARNDDEDDEFDLVDRAALELAIKLTLEEKDQGRVAQIKSMLADLQRPWSETACFCAYHRQAGCWTCTHGKSRRATSIPMMKSTWQSEAPGM